MTAKEATVFDLRTEAEMRLHSERTARELALKKEGEVAPASREADRESASDETQSPPT